MGLKYEPASEPLLIPAKYSDSVGLTDYCQVDMLTYQQGGRMPSSPSLGLSD